MFKFLKKLFGKKEEVPEVKLAVKEETDWANEVLLSGNIRMRLNVSMPVAILDSNGQTLCNTRVQKSTGAQLILGRLPGEVKLPTFEKGTEITVMAFNVDVEAVRMTAVVAESTVISLVLRQLNQLDYTTHRGSARLPVNRTGTLILPGSGKSFEEAACKLIDVSMTGAHIETAQELNTGDVVRLRFELFEKDGSLSVNAEVVWVRSTNGSVYNCGLLFEEMEGWRKKYLTQSIKELRENLERATKGKAK